MEQLTAQVGGVAIADKGPGVQQQHNQRPRHSNLYVSGAQLNSEDELRSLFSQCGIVESCRLVRNARDTKTFAFVKMSSIQESLDAIATLNGRHYAGAALEVKTADADAGDRNPELLAPPSDNLYAKNLPKNITEDELCALFSPFGAVVECRVLHSGAARADSGTGAGALVRMAAVDEAAAAIAALHNERLPGAPMPLVVRFADSQEQKAKKAARMQRREHSLTGSSSGGGGGSSGAGAARWGPAPGGGGGGGAGFSHYPQQQQRQHPYPFGGGPVPAGYAAGPRAAPAGVLHYERGPGSYDSHHSPHHPLNSPVPGGHYYSPVAGPPHHQHMQPFPHHGHAGGPGSSSGGSSGGSSVYVKNLPDETDRLWLYERFGPFGGVLSVRVLTSEDGACRGVGFINYADPESAARAVAAMQGLPVGERRLFVALQAQQRGGGGPRG